MSMDTSTCVQYCQKLNSLLLFRPLSPACLMLTGVQMAFKSPLDKQATNCGSLHDWLMSLAMYVVAPMDAIWLFLVNT